MNSMFCMSINDSVAPLLTIVAGSLPLSSIFIMLTPVLIPRSVCFSKLSYFYKVKYSGQNYNRK